jgi:hypothetical protein
MRWLILALLMLGACKDRDESMNASTAASEEPGRQGSAGKGGERGAKDAPLRLTGLWEAGSAPQKSQLCMTGEGAEAEFGLTVAGPGAAICAGAGKAVRSGEQLTLTMSGDRACELTARIEGSAIVLPASAPESCSYYCAEGARLAGVRLTRSGSTRADALKAKDLAGDPLCG